jgi:WD40 repeat protein
MAPRRGPSIVLVHRRLPGGGGLTVRASRQSLTLALVVTLGLVSILLNLVTNDLTNGSSDAVPGLRVLRQWSLPALAVLVLLLLGGQVTLFVLERPSRRRWTGRRPPYPGLEPFTAEDAPVFFGREAETRELVDRLSPVIGQAAHRFVAVVGPSGSGKSSLVQAGLLPALAGQRRRWLLVPAFVPEDRPVANLAGALAAMAPGPAAPGDPAERLAGGAPALVAWLDELRLASGGRSAPALLFLDQAEELLTATPPGRRHAFLRLLRDAIAIDRRLWVVATIRSEFMDDLLTAGFSDLLHQPVVVGSPSRSALFEIIERPAGQIGLRFAPGLVGRMVDDTGGGDALPMLAYTLEALYRRAGPGGMVTERDYLELGGVEGALSDQADRIAAAVRAGHRRDAVIPTLLRFVSLDESGPVRRRVLRSLLDADERRVVDAFVAARLLTSDVERGDAVVRVAHEALFRRWPPLRQAVEAGAETLRRRAQLERWAVDWVRSGRRDSYLLTGERLELAQQAAHALGPAIGEQPAVVEFLEHSRRLDRAAMQRLARAVADRALGHLERDPELATLLALAAVEECAVTPETWETLLAVTLHPGIRVLRGHADGLWSVAWSPAGDRLLTGSEDWTARVWDAWLGVELTVLGGHEDGLLDVAWSPDGARVATIARDRTLRVWDAAGGDPLQTILHEARLRTVAWSPDGSLIACGAEDGAVELWDVAAGAVRMVLRGHDNWVRALAWSPDGATLATGSDDRVVRVWEVGGGALRESLHGHAGGIRALAWAPGGDRLATASVDGTARIWGPVAGEVLVLRGHDEVVRGLAWEPGRGRIVTCADDRTVRLWDADRGTCLAVLRGHDGAVRDVGFQARGGLLATASEDRTARLWAADRGADLAVLRGHEGTVHAVAWSPEGRRLATASRDQTIRVWDAESGVELLALHGHEANIRSVAWSPDGRLLASSSVDRTARVWDLEAARQVLVLHGHEDAVRGVAWSPEGRRLVTASEDRTARVWDAGSGRELLAVRGHRDMVRAAAWSPEGRRIATGTRDRVGYVWDAERGTLIAELCGHEGTLRGLAWSPEGRRVATGSDDGTVRVWDAERGTELATLDGHRDWVRCVSWCADGSLLATGSADGTVRTWDPERGVEVAMIGVHGELVEGVAWSPEGRRVATASRDRTARIWDAASGLDRLLDVARSRVTRSLTPEEHRDAMLP